MSIEELSVMKYREFCFHVSVFQVSSLKNSSYTVLKSSQPCHGLLYLILQTVEIYSHPVLRDGQIVLIVRLRLYVLLHSYLPFSYFTLFIHNNLGIPVIILVIQQLSSKHHERLQNNITTYSHSYNRLRKDLTYDLK